MLGRLARCLRILGYDTAYAGHLNDSRILAWARYEGRILLTRDHLLAKRAGALAILVEEEKINKQLSEIDKKTGLTKRAWFSRCPVCNQALELTTSADSRPYIPLYVYRGFSEVKRCPSCQRIFWKGTHWVRFRNSLLTLLDT